LQAAVDALPETGGVMKLPPGQFEITEPIVIETQDALLEGEGTGTHIVNKNTDGKPAIIIRPKTHATDARAKVWRVQVSNLRVTGSEKSGHGIHATRVNEILIDRVTVSYHGGDGIRLDQCYEDPRVANCLITYNKHTGVALKDCHDIVIVGTHFEENLDAVHCIDGFNLCMSGNNVDDHLGDGIVIENTYGSIVSSNMIEECKGTGVILDRDCYGITIAANTIAHHQKGGIDLRDAHGIAVTGNTFPLVRQKALMIGPASGRITVTGNHFSGSYIGDGKTKLPTDTQPASGITLSGTSDIAITGNAFSGLQTKAVTLDGATSRRVVFTGNVLTDVESGLQDLVDSKVADNVGL
jgi:hypothetical protein